MIPQWLIEKKRDGGELLEAEIRDFIHQYATDVLPDYQMAAMAMAVYFQGMTFEETAVLTDAMMRTGDLLDTSSLSGPKADKHSTGGIGDKVSLVLAPLAACCGVNVPMISGRGLGITGGTLDKLESIPGYRTDLNTGELLKVLDACGCSIIGQTQDIAPADRKLYALRDVTATVPSIPLIVASIMSKKLAEGLDALVLDVKWGSGAFMKTYDDAMQLARNLVEVGHRMGTRTAAILTDMNQPLGRTAGNALEVRETLDCLRGEGPADLMQVTMALTAHMLVLADRVPDLDAARADLQKALDSGRALDRFLQMVALHNGQAEDLEKALPQASLLQEISAETDGIVSRVDANAIGRACIILGAGRTRTDEAVDHAVGIAGLAKVGEQVRQGSVLAEVHANDEKRLEEALLLIRDAIRVEQELAEPPLPLIRETVLPGGAAA